MQSGSVLEMTKHYNNKFLLLLLLLLLLLYITIHSENTGYWTSNEKGEE